MRDAIEMAREVKATAYTNRHYPDRTTYTFGPEQLEAFANLVRADERNKVWSQKHWTEYERSIAAAEREACAQVAADYAPSRPIVGKNPSPKIVGRWEGEQAASSGIEAAIRARGNT